MFLVTRVTLNRDQVGFHDLFNAYDSSTETGVFAGFPFPRPVFSIASLPLQQSRNQEMTSTNRPTIKRKRLGFESLEGRRVLAAVTIEPDAFAGFYDVAGIGRYSGAQNLELAEGTYTLRVLGVANFEFAVNASGAVTSLNSAAATGSGSTLTLANTQVNVDPGAFDGFYDLVGRLSGPQSYTLVPGINDYAIKIQGTSRLTFDVDASGNVSSDNAAAATGNGNTLTFANTQVNVDPGAFVGYYDLIDRLSGPQSYTLVPGINDYAIKVQGTSRLTFDIDASGIVSSDNVAAATGNGNTLTFANTQVTVDPGAFVGYYDLIDRLTGIQNYTLVPGLDNYSVKVAGSIPLTFDLDSSGQVSSDNPIAAVGNGSVLEFQTSTIQIDPGGYPSLWYVTSIPDGTGVQIMDLPKGLSGYRLNVSGERPSFSIDDTGTPQPNEIPITVGGQTYQFLLTPYTPEPPVLQVEIDVKPDSDQNTVNVGSNGTIAVAILTTPDFDAADVNTASVVFAGALADHYSYEDVDGDGDLDLLMHFRTNETNLEQVYQDLLAGDLDGDGILDSTNQNAEVSLTGETLDETLIEGVDELNLFLRGRALRELLNDLYGS